MRVDIPIGDGHVVVVRNGVGTDLGEIHRFYLHPKGADLREDEPLAYEELIVPCPSYEAWVAIVEACAIDFGERSLTKMKA